MPARPKLDVFQKLTGCLGFWGVRRVMIVLFVTKELHLLFCVWLSFYLRASRGLCLAFIVTPAG